MKVLVGLIGIVFLCQANISTSLAEHLSWAEDRNAGSFEESRAFRESMSFTSVGQWMDGPSHAVDIQAGVAYFGNGKNLEICDASVPSSLVTMGSLTLADVIQNLTVAGNYVYVGAGAGGLRIVDVTIPEQPREVGSLDTGGFVRGVTVAGNYAYLCGTPHGLLIVDISDPADPVPKGNFQTVNLSVEVAVSGIYAYWGVDWVGLMVVNVSDPMNPFMVNSIPYVGDVYGITLVGNYLFAVNGTELCIIDITDPDDPVMASISYPISSPQDVCVGGDYAFIAAGESGLGIVNVSDPSAPSFVTSFDTGDEAHGVAVAGNEVYIADRNDGLRVVNVTVPTNPVEIDSIDAFGQAHNVVVRDNLAYMADGDAGLRIIDVSERQTPIGVGIAETPGRAFDVALAGNYAYVADMDDGLRVVNVLDPREPFDTGHMVFGLPAFGVAVQGNYAYLASGTDGLLIYDVSVPEDPEEVGVFGVPGLAYSVALMNELAYLAWTFDSFGGLIVIDISDPADPVEYGSLDTGGGYDVVLSGHYALLTDSWDGLRIIDISHPESPSEVSFFPLNDYCRGVAVRGDFAYVANRDSGVMTINFADPFNPYGDGNFETTGPANGVYALGNEVFVADESDVLWILENDNILGPTIVSVEDVGADQGRQVRLQWLKAVPDGPGLHPVEGYAIFRRQDANRWPCDPAQPGEANEPLSSAMQPSLLGWDYLVTVPASGEDYYQCVVPTLCDSTSAGRCWSVFFVGAMTDNPTVFYDSPPDSGFSIDNLEPEAPENLGFLPSSILTWDEVPDADFNYYTVYRSPSEDFNAPEMVGTTIELEYDVSGSPDYFLGVSATDFAGNEGALSEPVFHQVSAVQMSNRFVLHANVPNPFNPSTVIRYELPHRAVVDLQIYDLAGRRIRVLEQEALQDRGFHDVTWNGRDDAGRALSSGVYVCRLTAGTYQAHIRMVLIR